MPGSIRSSWVEKDSMSLWKIGQKVSRGDKLMEIDLDYIRANAPSDAVPLVFTNLGEHHLELLKLGTVSVEDELIRVR